MIIMTINEERTFTDFGYTSADLSYGSGKKVWAICKNCRKERLVTFSHYRDLCLFCTRHNPMYGKHHTEETKLKISKSHINKKHSEETKFKMSKSRSGKNNPAWQGGISFEPYCINFNNKIKEQIREEFNRKCFLCGKNEQKNNAKLSIHHIDYNKNQGCNGLDWLLIPVCRSCHTKTSGKYVRDYYENLISRLLHIRELILEYNNKIDYRSI